MSTSAAAKVIADALALSDEERAPVAVEILAEVCARQGKVIASPRAVNSGSHRTFEKGTKGAAGPKEEVADKYVPTLEPAAFVKDATATSTFVDKKNM